MTDLTEQFNNDELDENKLYYFKQKMSEEIEIGHPFSLNMVRAVDDIYLDWFLIDKVLAPVPSYDEWFKIKNLASLTSLLQEKNIECLHRENKLKELLKECKRQFEEVELCRYDVADIDQEDWFKISTEQAGVANKMIFKINQELGEDK